MQVLQYTVGALLFYSLIIKVKLKTLLKTINF